MMVPTRSCLKGLKLQMREARTKLQQVRKDRGYQGPQAAGSSTSGATGGGPKRGIGQSALRKQSGKHPCYDCGQHGHWAGDPECPKPGQGLLRKPCGGKGRPPVQRQVRVAEHLNEVQTVESRDVPDEAEIRPNEVLMITSFSEALGNSALEASKTSANQGEPRGDKTAVGALDSACNRTCAGSLWIERYLKALQNAPSEIQNLVGSIPEAESFRFGNGGVTPSYERWRLPAILNEVLVLIWVSVVPVALLGLLLGRDYLEAL